MISHNYSDITFSHFNFEIFREFLLYDKLHSLLQSYVSVNLFSSRTRTVGGTGDPREQFHFEQPLKVVSILKLWAELTSLDVLKKS